MQLKDEMTVDAMQARELAIVPYAMDKLAAIPRVHLLAQGARHRLAMLSFWVEGVHYNLMVRLLNDRFGVQSRGGCSCAGTYGHYLLHVDPSRSKAITDRIDRGDLSEKPGWVRLSFHPSTTMADIDYAIAAVAECVANVDAWSRDYVYSNVTNEYHHKNGDAALKARVQEWFALSPPRPSPHDA